MGKTSVTSPSDDKKLTLKQRKFIEIYLETGNATKAARQVYNCKDDVSAASVGYETLKNLQIDELMEQYGISDKRLLNVLDEGLGATRTSNAAILLTQDGKTVKAEEQGLIEVADHATRHRFLETALKMKKRLGNDAPSTLIQNNYNDHVRRELEDFRD